MFFIYLFSEGGAMSFYNNYDEEYYLRVKNGLEEEIENDVVPKKLTEKQRLFFIFSLFWLVASIIALIINVKYYQLLIVGIILCVSTKLYELYIINLYKKKEIHYIVGYVKSIEEIIPKSFVSYILSGFFKDKVEANIYYKVEIEFLDFKGKHQSLKFNVKQKNMKEECMVRIFVRKKVVVQNVRGEDLLLDYINYEVL